MAFAKSTGAKYHIFNRCFISSPSGQGRTLPNLASCRGADGADVVQMRNNSMENMDLLDNLPPQVGLGGGNTTTCTVWTLATGALNQLVAGSSPAWVTYGWGL